MITAQEKKFEACYEKLKDVIQLDYPMAFNVLRCFHEIAFETLDSDFQIETAVELPQEANFGATVKIEGKINFVVGVFAEKKIFHELAEKYVHFETESIDEDFDAIAEFLNVVTGILIVKVATIFGIEEELEPPRYGQTEKNFGVIQIRGNIGIFYLYIGKDEIF